MDTVSGEVARDPAGRGEHYGHDAMADGDMAGMVRKGVGYLLLGGGVGVCLWVVVTIHTVITSTADVGLLRRFGDLKPEDLVIDMPPDVIRLPVATLTMFGYVVMVVLLIIGARLGVTLIKTGGELLRKIPQ